MLCFSSASVEMPQYWAKVIQSIVFKFILYKNEFVKRFVYIFLFYNCAKRENDLPADRSNSFRTRIFSPA